ncbi:nucleotidyltransferase [Porphyromonadaceae bacterium OttesenSCG-928-L07]|nr:nucleotidyltransferase [Porphyromonadaceae bacterium OttesenSCG-928-L07]MDL2252257.1 nucleotidyltransferase [Odoribacter sp. OttesenSCG-928-J03]MDL2330812.1 nucleotidyltransferase [Odoribacter sp. OttesenSCG-928-A06]
MTKNKTTLLVMAAGMGSRFGSLKQMTPLGPHNKTLLHYTVYDAVQAGFSKIVFIIRESFAEEFKNFIGKYAENLAETVYCFQDMDKLPGNMPPVEREKPWGTAHAIWSAKEAINEPFIAINADDFYGRDAFVKAYDFLANSTNKEENCLVGYRLDSTLSENGTVSRGVCKADENQNLTSVTEYTKIRLQSDGSIQDEESKTTLNAGDIVSTNFWGFKPEIFHEIEAQFTEFYNNNKENPKAEIYIPSVVDTMIKKGVAHIKVLSTSAKWFGVTYKEDTAFVNAALEAFDKIGQYKDL